jgi:hypothetical protein
MGLIKCPACGASISNEADRCIHCGHPIKRGFFGAAGTERIINIGCLIFIIVIVAIALVIVMGLPVVH